MEEVRQTWMVALFVIFRLSLPISLFQTMQTHQRLPLASATIEPCPCAVSL